jgi:hypothetical protein
MPHITGFPSLRALTMAHARSLRFRIVFPAALEKAETVPFFHEAQEINRNLLGRLQRICFNAAQIKGSYDVFGHGVIVLSCCHRRVRINVADHDVNFLDPRGKAVRNVQVVPDQGTQLSSISAG